MKRGKKYLETLKKVDKTKAYSIDEAAKLVKELNTAKFDSSVEITMQVEIKSKKQNESLKGSVVLPNSFGTAKRVAVIAEVKDQKIATDAGADKVGGEDIIKEIESGKIDFDILIATPPMMPKIASLGKVLGPKGLLPNPKNETVTTNIERVVKSYKAGKLDYKMTEGFTIQAKVGSVKMDDIKLAENIREFIKVISSDAKNLSANPFKKIMLKPSMGPAIKLEIEKI